MIMLGLCFFQHSHTYTGKLLVSPHLSLPRPLISLSSPYTTIWSVIGEKEREAVKRGSDFFAHNSLSTCSLNLNANEAVFLHNFL